MTNERFVSLVLRNKWTFAKTMAYMPHEYTLRRDFANDADFVDMVKHIRQHGIKEKFGKTEYTYFYINGWKYWTMGCPLHNCDKTGTILINRAQYKPEKSEYDNIAMMYEGLFSAPKFRIEDGHLFALIKSHIQGRVLDIGCGTGLLLDFMPEIEYRRGGVSYIGVDTSRGMLDVFEHKHSAPFIHDKFRNVFAGSFDTIVALYGTASYFDEREVDMVIEYLAPGGKYILMTYADDYHPYTHEVFSIPYDGPGVPMPKDSIVTRWGKYDIHTNFAM